jgi:hypothetical protein
MDQLLKDLDIDEKHSKAIKKVRKFHKVKDNIPLFEDYNFMQDILMLPTTIKGYKYLLVMVDLATDEFDIEELKNKDSNTVLKAMQTIFKRKYLNKPFASIRTDGGKEFLGDVKKYMFAQNILHKQGLPGRHIQVANVESLNRALGRLFNGYMNSVENKTGKVYREWTDVIDKVRIGLNKFRKKPGRAINHIYPIPDSSTKNKYNAGDMVFRQLDQPRNSLNEKLHGDNFREGDVRWDIVPKKIKQVLYYPGKVPYRYLLNGIPNASFAEHQLKKADTDDELNEVKKVLDRRLFDDEIHYKIWFYEEKKGEADWYPKSELIKFIPDVLKTFDKEYDKKHVPVPKKRGRPPKDDTPAPKKRGRPPKLIVPEQILPVIVPKKRGRPPKVIVPAPIVPVIVPKKRGRAPKVIVPEPKKRGRPPKVK